MQTQLCLHKHTNYGALFVFQDFLRMLLEDIPEQKK